MAQVLESDNIEEAKMIMEALVLYIMLAQCSATVMQKKGGSVTCNLDYFKIFIYTYFKK